MQRRIRASWRGRCRGAGEVEPPTRNAAAPRAGGAAVRRGLLCRFQTQPRDAPRRRGGGGAEAEPRGSVSLLHGPQRAGSRADARWRRREARTTTKSALRLSSTLVATSIGTGSALCRLPADTARCMAAAAGGKTRVAGGQRTEARERLLSAVRKRVARRTVARMRYAESPNDKAVQSSLSYSPVLVYCPSVQPAGL